MNQEAKELLLKDLCARLYYGVMCQVDDGAAGLNDGKLEEIDIPKECVRFETDINCYWDAYIDDVKPYLRPMSSMTEEEEEEYWTIRCPQYDENGKIINKDGEMFDWLNKKMFDYRGLIEKGLALEATEGMYKNNKTEIYEMY